MRGGFSGGVHSVLRNLVDSSRRRFLMEAKQLIQWSGAMSYRIGLFDCFCDVSFRENQRVAKLLPARKLSGHR